MRRRSGWRRGSKAPWMRRMAGGQLRYTADERLCGGFDRRHAVHAVGAGGVRGWIGVAGGGGSLWNAGLSDGAADRASLESGWRWVRASGRSSRLCCGRVFCWLWPEWRWGCPRVAAVTRAIRELLYGVRPLDGVTLLGVVASGGGNSADAPAVCRRGGRRGSIHRYRLRSE